MKHDLPRRFWLEAGLAAASAVLLVVTLLWKDWIEIVFRVDPDQGSGSFEWMIVGVTAVAAVTCSILARVEWKRAQEVT
jgi:hypothetical protein